MHNKHVSVYKKKVYKYSSVSLTFIVQGQLEVRWRCLPSVRNIYYLFYYYFLFVFIIRTVSTYWNVSSFFYHSMLEILFVNFPFIYYNEVNQRSGSLLFTNNQNYTRVSLQCCNKKLWSTQLFTMLDFEVILQC